MYGIQFNWNNHTTATIVDKEDKEVYTEYTIQVPAVIIQSWYTTYTYNIRIYDVEKYVIEKKTKHDKMIWLVILVRNDEVAQLLAATLYIMLQCCMLIHNRTSYTIKCIET